MNVYLILVEIQTRTGGERRRECHVGVFPPHYFHGFLPRDKMGDSHPA